MVLKVKNITFFYDNKKILDNISFEALSCEILSIVGPNGSGKTTLLRCIDKILTPQGEILFNGKNMKKMSIDELSKVVSFLPQTEPYPLPMLAFDVVLHGRKPYVRWQFTKEDLEKTENIFKELGIYDLAYRNILELSGGERQKILLARTLVQETKIILLDEPTANLDLKYQYEVFNIIKNICKERKAIVICAIHDLNLACRFSDKIILLKEGKLYKIGTPDEVFTYQNIKEVYNIKVTIKKEKNFIYILPE